MKKVIVCLFAVSMMLCLFGCTKEEEKEESKSWVTADVVTSSETLHVTKVENLPDDFIMGMDVSSVLSEEASGVKYYDYAGEECDLFEVLAESGINYIRVRIWNDPYDADGNGYGGGNCDIETAVEIGKRMAKYGLKMLVDFHYSDFWADPSKQMVPKAWESMTVDEKATALYEYTKECLAKLNEAGVDVGMVQIGNETNGSLCGETKWVNICKLMIQSSKAIRETCPNALIAVHFTNPEKADNLLDYAFRVDYYQLDYDVFGTSYYPYWHGTLENLSSVLTQIAEKYNKKVMVMETSYANTEEDTDFWDNTIGTSGYDSKDYPFTVAGQANFLRELTDTLVNKTKDAIGICYWEGAWITVGTESLEQNQTLWETYGSGWASSYAGEYDSADAGKWYGGSAVDNQAFFDATGKPFESLKVFALMRNGNDATPYVDGVLDAVESAMTDDKTYTLPTQVWVVYSDNTKVLTDVEWSAFDLDAARAAGNGKYTIEGKAAGYTVYCQLTMMEYNFVSNYSFEESSEDPWKKTVNSGALSSTHKVQVTAENPQTGTYAYHFWTSDASGVNFDITQQLSLTNSGTYKLAFSVLGGGQGTSSITESAENVFGYVKIDGEVVATVPVKITCYSDGYQNYLLEGIHYEAGQTIEIGIHVEITEANCWGDIDDVMFNYVGD